MTPAQYRMARAALGWTTRQVANSINVSTGTSASLLRGDTFTTEMTARLQAAFEAEGVAFIEDSGSGPGVCFREPAKESAADYPKPRGPATDIIKRMEADIAADQGKRKPK